MFSNRSSSVHNSASIASWITCRAPCRTSSSRPRPRPRPRPTSDRPPTSFSVNLLMVDGLLFASFRLRQSDSQLKPPPPSISRAPTSPVHQNRAYLLLYIGLKQNHNYSGTSNVHSENGRCALCSDDLLWLRVDRGWL